MSRFHAAAGVAVVATGLAVGASGVGATVGTAEIDTAASATEPAMRVGNQTPTVEPEPEFADYRVTVISDWTTSSHPATLPPNSHFSPSVVAVHGQIGSLFAAGTTASPGIEQMAETGATSQLIAELGVDDFVTDVQVGSSIFGAGQNGFEVSASQSDDLVSVVTMLAPSPDWFVGVRDVELFVDEAWVDRIELDFSNYDAGTDSGFSWTSSNADTSPAQVISGPRDATFTEAVDEGRFGRVIIERI